MTIPCQLCVDLVLNKLYTVCHLRYVWFIKMTVPKEQLLRKSCSAFDSSFWLYLATACEKSVYRQFDNELSWNVFKAFKTYADYNDIIGLFSSLKIIDWWNCIGQACNLSFTASQCVFVSVSLPCWLRPQTHVVHRVFPPQSMSRRLT